MEVDDKNSNNNENENGNRNYYVNKNIDYETNLKVS